MIQEKLQLPSPPATVAELHVGVQDSSSPATAAASEPTSVVEVPPGCDVPTTTTAKQGHRFFGFMCDMRRAVIAVNVIEIVLSIISICFLITMLALYDSMLETGYSNQDPWYQTYTYNKVTKAFIGVGIAFCFLSIVFCSLGIRGAIKFHQPLVCTALIYHCVGLVLGLFSLNIISILLSALFVYPHVILYNELRNGVMSEENYADERKVCCGV